MQSLKQAWHKRRLRDLHRHVITYCDRAKPTSVSAHTLKEENSATEGNATFFPSCTCKVHGNSDTLSWKTHSRTYIKHFLASSKAAETRGGSWLNGGEPVSTYRPFSPASSRTLSRPRGCRAVLISSAATTFVTRPWHFFHSPQGGMNRIVAPTARA